MRACFGVLVFWWASLLVFENKGFPNSDTKSEAHQNTKTPKHLNTKTPLSHLNPRRQQSFPFGVFFQKCSHKGAQRHQFEVVGINIL